MLTTFSLLALLTSAFLNQSAPATPRQAPEITWTVPGQGQQMLRQYLGKVVAIEFIYTTCNHCLIPAQALQKLQREMGEQGLQTIAVAFNPNAPFGGYKQSGIGREYGRYGLEEFLQVKSLQL